MKPKTHFKEFMHYTILSVLGTLGVSCYILADTFFISKGLGAAGLAALNIAIPIYNFIYGTGLMLGIGGSTKFSISKSQNDKDEANQIYTNTVYLAVLFSAIFVILGFSCSKLLASMLRANESIFEMTDTYLRWLLLFSPAFIFNNILLCFVRNDEKPQLSMVAMLAGSFSNIILDYIFIFPMKMGIFGAVFATGLSPVISITIMSSCWIKKKNSFHFTKGKIRTDIFRQNLKLGFPSLIMQLSSGIVMIIFNILILKSEGNIGVAAYGIIANISLVVVAVYTGISQGVQPLISRFYGIKNIKQTYTVLRYAIVTMAFLSVIIYILIFVFAQQITSVFNSENNLSLQGIAETGLKLYFISVTFVGYNIILATFFTSIERAMPAHILSVLRGFVLVIPMAFILSAAWGMTGIWLAYPITEFIASILGFIIYKYYKKLL